MMKLQACYNLMYNEYKLKNQFLQTVFFDSSVTELNAVGIYIILVNYTKIVLCLPG